ncbi:hypothetical protein GUJ93_ZPchr0010g10931 [Zizania palustris]|uniref:DYW domain-containing protein n=1 Tax=Zizania palustris TaxID=103762 RepID=A0A8J5W9W9_ZIZPA|nr:hypothetical protein GUJ93_ZPchr0010g10931 [Zizania palustris]
MGVNPSLNKTAMRVISPWTLSNGASHSHLPLLPSARFPLPCRHHAKTSPPPPAALRSAVRTTDSFCDARVLVSLLRECADLLHEDDTHRVARRLVPQLHSLAVRTGHSRDPRVTCTLVDLLARLGRGPSCTRLLEEAEDGKDAVLWNKHVAMLAEAEEWAEAITVFRQMQARGVPADGYTCTRVLHACGRAGAVRQGRTVHAHALKLGLDAHPLVPGFLAGMYAENADIAVATRVLDEMGSSSIVPWNAVIACCARLGLVDDALELAERMARSGPEPNVVTWNTVLSGCSRHGRDWEALGVLTRMLKQGLRPDATTVSSLLKSVASTGLLGHGMEIHCFFLRNQIEPDVFTGTALVDMYVKCGRLDCAQRVFDALEHRNLTTWNSLIAGYANAGQFNRALELVELMKRNRLDPDITTWNGLITGYSMNGLSSQAMQLLRQIKAAGVTPNKDSVQPSLVTMSVLLRACAGLALLKKGKELHCFALRRAYDRDMVVRTALIDISMCLVTEGWEYFDSMETKYGVTPAAENYACMVDLLGRCGYLDEAMDFIKRSPVEPGASLWGALLTGCSIHGNLGLAEVAARNLFRLEPYNSANYLLMMSLYEHEQMYDEAESLKYAMKARGVDSRLGWSWIQIEQNIHVFEVDGKPHPETAEIYEELIRLVLQIKQAGYVPDTSCIAYNVQEEEKEKLLLGHTEKLAITYGLINSDSSRVPVRVIKNTRMCKDCHEVAKHISSLCDRQIILRDAVRFHHIVDGKCSCNDYW